MDIEQLTRLFCFGLGLVIGALAGFYWGLMYGYERFTAESDKEPKA